MAYNIRAIAYFFKWEFDRLRHAVDMAQDLEYPAFLELSKALREASGTKR
jgi:hypothetical protein